MNETRKVKLDYVMKLVVATKDNIEQFARYPTKRRVRTSQVKHLLNVLKEGGSFPVMYVNRGSKLTKKELILDGNHRYDALKQFFDLYPDASVELRIGVYEISDPKIEKQKFLDLNHIIKPTSDDIINQYTEDNEFLKKLLKQVDICSVYGSSQKPLKIRLLMSAYIQAIQDKWAPNVLTGHDIVQKMEGYTTADINVIKAFLAEYQAIFGALNEESDWIKTTIFTTIFRIWYQNKGQIEFSKLQSKFRLLINHYLVKEFAKMGGREACKQAAEKFVDMMNSTGRNYNFIIAKPLEHNNEATTA